MTGFTRRSRQWYQPLVGAALAASWLSATTGVAEGKGVFGLANRCVAMRSLANGKFVVADTPSSYRAGTRGKRRASAFFMKASALGKYLPQDDGKKLLNANSRTQVGRADLPGPTTQWKPVRVGRRGFALVATSNGRWLAIAPGTGTLVLAGGDARRRTRFALVRTRGCARFPEAKLGAAGKPFRGTTPGGAVRGFADIHLHITADLRAGGRVIHGASFNRFGITRALGFDERDHGPDGSADIIGNLLRNGTPFGTHDTRGWPSFVGWPVFDTNTHQQVYYRWLQRVWRSGERLVVAQTVEDEPLCMIEPIRSHGCNETGVIKLQIRRLRALQRYVDAQSGGPGRGWFRLVYSPRQARRVIARGKLAVVIGIESSNLFGCSERDGKPQCNRRDIDRGIAMYRRLGVRSLFPVHWVDNAFAGAAIEGGNKGTFINVFNRLQTGHYFRTGPCPHPSQGEEPRSLAPFELQVLANYFPAASELTSEAFPSYPPGKQCNAKGLTKLGAYLIRRLIANRMLIEADHISERARVRVLKIAARRRYPLVSSHTNTGGVWTRAELRRLYRLGGIAAATPDQASQLSKKILRLRGAAGSGGALGTDTGGFSSLPAPRSDAAQDPLQYPFRSFRGQTRFSRQRTGTRTFDLNTDGVAHYGLMPDLLADARQSRRGSRALRILFHSAEAYLRTWRRVTRHP